MDLITYVQAEMVKALMAGAGAKPIVVPSELWNNASDSTKQQARTMCDISGMKLVVETKKSTSENTMANCDLCGMLIDASAKRFSAAQMRTAVRAGLRPSGGPLDAMVAITEIPVDHQDWIRQVMTDSTDWATCPSCTSKVEAHLKKSWWQFWK